MDFETYYKTRNLLHLRGPSRFEGGYFNPRGRLELSEY